VLIGRAFLYGLGALGEAGVLRTLELMRKELESTMALCGLTDVADVGRQAIVTPMPMGVVAPAQASGERIGEGDLSMLAS
jgi:L-lactate dehydrogenase (cytochrome)